MDFNIGRMKAEAMANAFGVEIEKGRVGVYEDNAENRRLNRVGQAYGKKKQEEAPKGKQPAAQEQQGSGDIGKQAAAASDGALKRAAADPKAAPEVKQAAQAEIKKRGGIEGKNGKKAVDSEGNDIDYYIKTHEKMLSQVDKDIEKYKKMVDETKDTAIRDFLKNALSSTIKSRDKIAERIEKFKKEKSQGTEKEYKGKNSATNELAAILDPLDSWGDDDWNDADKNAELFSQIRSVISKYDMSEEEFREVAKKYQGLDLVYTDYAPHDKVVPIAKEKIRTELKKFDSFSDDDWNEPDKQQEITDKLTFYVRHYNITEDEWNEIVKPYAEGLSGLPYSDFQ